MSEGERVLTENQVKHLLIFSYVRLKKKSKKCTAININNMINYYLNDWKIEKILFEQWVGKNLDSYNTIKSELEEKYCIE